MKHIFTLIAALAVLALATVTPTRYSLPRPAQSVRPLIAAIFDHSTGTSPLRNTCTVSSVGQSLWLTAAHCVFDTNTETPERYPGLMQIEGHDVSVTAVNFTYDVILVTTPGFSIPALKMTSRGPTYQDVLHIWGYPDGTDDVMVFDGIVASPAFHAREKVVLLTTLPVARGNSGSPVLNTHDQLVSMTIFGNATNDRVSILSGGVSFDDLTTFLHPFLK